MPEAAASFTAPVRVIRREEPAQRPDNPGRAFANGLLLALPLWGMIGAAIWAIA